MLELHGTPDTVEAIKRLAVRGAPLIGVAAAYGLAMELARDESPEALERAAALMAGARPTARNLGWAVERVTTAALAQPDRMADAAREAAEQIHREDEAASAALARHGADALETVLPDGPVAVMTHCNSGALAASGRGTGLGVIAELADRRPVTVLACEARPLLQGARLTVWECRRLGLDHELLVDSAAAGLIRRGEVARGRHRLRPRRRQRRRREQGRHLRARAGRPRGADPVRGRRPVVVGRPAARDGRRDRDRGARRRRGPRAPAGRC